MKTMSMKNVNILILMKIFSFIRFCSILEVGRSQKHGYETVLEW